MIPNLIDKLNAHFQKKEFDLNHLAENWQKQNEKLLPYQYATIKQGKSDIEAFKYLMNLIEEQRAEILSLDPHNDFKTSPKYTAYLNAPVDYRDTILNNMLSFFNDYAKSINNVNGSNSMYGNYILADSFQTSVFVSVVVSELKKYAEIAQKEIYTPETDKF